MSRPTSVRFSGFSLSLVAELSSEPTDAGATMKRVFALVSALSETLVCSRVASGPQWHQLACWTTRKREKLANERETVEARVVARRQFQNSWPIVACRLLILRLKAIKWLIESRKSGCGMRNRCAVSFSLCHSPRLAARKPASRPAGRAGGQLGANKVSEPIGPTSGRKGRSLARSSN